MDHVYSTRALGAGKDDRRIGRWSPSVLHAGGIDAPLTFPRASRACLPYVSCDRPSEVTSPALAHSGHGLPSKNVAVSARSSARSPGFVG